MFVAQLRFLKSPNHEKILGTIELDSVMGYFENHNFDRDIQRGRV